MNRRSGAEENAWWWDVATDTIRTEVEQGGGTTMQGIAHERTGEEVEGGAQGKLPDAWIGQDDRNESVKEVRRNAEVREELTTHANEGR